MDEARFKICSLEKELSSQSQASASVGASLRSIAQLCAGFRASFNQALTQIAHYERRVAFAAKRIRSLKGMGKLMHGVCPPIILSIAATLACKQALLASRSAGKSDAECQACGGLESSSDEEEGFRTPTVSRELLQVEVETLSRERDSLIGQLRDGTEAFQEQLKSVKDKCQ